MRLATALLLLLAGPALAQPAGSTILGGGGPGGDLGDAIAVHPYSGATAVVGTFEQTATFGPGVSVTSADAPAARSDAFVAFYAPDGTALWARRMGTNVFNDFGGGVALGWEGWFGDVERVYVSGYFTGIATFDGGANPSVTLTTRSDFDAFLAAYDTDGNLLWVTQAGGVEQDTGRGIAALGDAVVWSGSFSGTATWGEGPDADTRTSAGGSDGFLAAYSSDGELSWVTTVGGPESDDLRDVDVPAYSLSGYALGVTGTFRSVATFGTIPLSSRGLSDVAVLSVGFDGTVNWARQVGGNGNDYARGVAAAFDGRVAVAGSFENTILVGTDILTSAGFSDAVLAVFGADGTEIAGHRAGGEGFDIANAVAATPLLDTVTSFTSPLLPAFGVVGYVDGPSTFGATPLAAQGVDGFAAVYLSRPDDVTLEAAYAIGGANSDRAYGASVGGWDGFPMRITGSFRDAVTFGGESVTSAGSNDVFVATIPLCPTFTCPVLVGGDEGPEDGVRIGVSPNPSPVRLSLSLGSPADATVEIVDALGRTVARLNAGSLPAGETAWAAPRLAPGAYWLVARTGEGVYRQGFTVAR